MIGSRHFDRKAAANEGEDCMNGIVAAKFGGSSLADSGQFRKVRDIVLADERRRYIIPSAPGKRDAKDHKITDMFYLCNKLSNENLPFNEVFSLIEKRYRDIASDLGVQIELSSIFEHIRITIANGTSDDYAASRGEYLSGLLLSAYLGYDFVDAAELIFFDKNGLLDMEKTKEKIQMMMKTHQRAVIPGFYGSMENGRIRTFSRGGSDISGAIVAGAVGAVLYENWTDVSGFLMADPRIVKKPKGIERISYKELRELSYMGASVLHEESIFPVKHAGIPIHIKNTNAPEDKGTLIVNDKEPINYPKSITGIAGKKNFTVIALEKMRMSGERSFLRRLLSIAEEYDIVIEHMPSGIDSVSLVISDEGLEGKLEKLMESIRLQLAPDLLEFHPNMSLIAVVGRGMISTKGISAKVFASLRDSDVNIRMITQGSSEINIIVGVENEDFEKGIRAIYRAFED